MLRTLLDPNHLIATFGLIGIALAVFAESGLLIGLFLPGDSLLVTAGVLAAAGKLDFEVLVVAVFIAAVLGDQVGYMFGNRAGPALYRRPDSRLFKQEHLRKASAFYERHGGKTIILARFVPFVRTFAPIVAGAAHMRYPRFLAFNIVGGLVWGVGVTTIGFVAGRAVPDIDRYLLPIIGVIVLLSLAPVAVEALRHRRRARRSA